MKTNRLITPHPETGSTLLCALSIVAVLSLIGAGVLMNCTTRYNVASSQVKGWKEALQAAEAGGDIAFAEVRKAIGSSGSPFPTADGWSTLTSSWTLGYGTPLVLGAAGNMSAKITVDTIGTLPGSNPPVNYYRIRSIGTAQVKGLKRTGMDNRMDATTKGDNLFRKIDFNLDHFISTFGYGDAKASDAPTAGNGKSLVAVLDADKPQVSRRIELVATPIMPIEGAVKTAGRFRGTLVDSYDSANGAYAGSNPSGNSVYPPYGSLLADAHDGDVVCGGSDFSVGQVYGDVSTNGGAASTNNVSGVVDNNVPVALPTATPGTNPIPLMPGMTGGPVAELTSPSTINPTASTIRKDQVKTTFWYNYTNVSDVTANPLKTAGGTPIDTTVNLYVTGNVNGFNVAKGVVGNVYFRGDMGSKARDYDNLNVDGPVLRWEWFFASAAARTAATGFSAADNGKLAFQDGSPGTYWRLNWTGGTPAWNWTAFTPTTPRTAADVSCVPVPASLPVSLTTGNILPGYATAAERNAAGLVSATYRTVTSADVGKLAYQIDDNTYWKLMSVSGTTVTWVPTEPYGASTLVSKAGHMWFWGISPADGSARSIMIDPPGTMYAGFYAPSHDFTANGNPDFYGVMVAKTMYMNGNNTFHFDKQLAALTNPVDYRIASYVEDVR